MYKKISYNWSTNHAQGRSHLEWISTVQCNQKKENNNRENPTGCTLFSSHTWSQVIWSVKATLSVAMQNNIEVCNMMPLEQNSLKGPSQPHLCFCLHARIWLLYFIPSLSKQRKITVELLKIMKHTFWNTAYSKTMRIRFTMLYQ